MNQEGGVTHRWMRGMTKKPVNFNPVFKWCNMKRCRNNLPQFCLSKHAKLICFLFFFIEKEAFILSSTETVLFAVSVYFNFCVQNEQKLA